MIVEELVNHNGHLFHRCLVHPELMVGGFVLDAADWRHLHDDFGVRSVINVCTDQSDEGKGIANLVECRVPDDGQAFPAGLVRHAVSFAQLARGFGRIYVHCALGNSRSPAFAYAILRWVMGMTEHEALTHIRGGKPGLAAYGSHPVQAAYLTSVESALRLRAHSHVSQEWFVPCGMMPLSHYPWGTQAGGFKFR